jgi:hypothetical protein
VIPTPLPPGTETEEEEGNAYRQQENAHRAYHLKRITSKFRTTISPEGAQRLARLLSLDESSTGKE